MPLRAVFFDVGDTLWRSDGARNLPLAELAAAQVREVAARHGLDLPERLVAERVYDAVVRAVASARASGLVEPDYVALASAVLEELGQPVPQEVAAELLEACYVSGPARGKAAVPAAAAVLRCLARRGLRLGIVTNRAFGGPRFRRDLLEAGFDVQWDVIAVSSEVGVLKPHPRIFTWALAQAGVEPGEALMVGDSYAEDIRGAKRVGMRTAWVPVAPCEVRTAEDADWVLESLEQLVELVEREGAA